MPTARPPKLLFLAWNFPPVQAIASVRTWNLAKYLSRLGWKVTVVTPQPEVCKHIEGPAQVEVELAEEGIQRILTDHKWRCLEPVHLACGNDGVVWFLVESVARLHGPLVRMTQSVGSTLRSGRRVDSSS